MGNVRALWIRTKMKTYEMDFILISLFSNPTIATSYRKKEENPLHPKGCLSSNGGEGFWWLNQHHKCLCKYR